MAAPKVISRTSTQEELASDYKWGFVTDIEADIPPKGLNEDVVRLISAKKGEPEWMTEWRLKAYRYWISEDYREPRWSKVSFPPIDYQDIHYYSAPVKKEKGPESLDEVDPELVAAFNKLGIPLAEQKALTGVAVDAVFDSVSVATTYQKQLEDLGIIFGPISEAIQKHPELVKKYLGSVVPYSDNFYATLNSAVFSDGTFAYVPPGVRCPVELMTYFRMNSEGTGQFERTLIIADKGSYVSYLEGCTAPMRKTHQLHAAVVELIALDDAEIKYSTLQNWYPGDKDGKGGVYNFVTKRGKAAGKNSKISWTQVDRLRDYLEVPELHPPGRQLRRRVLLCRALQQPPAGGHRHEDDPHGEEHPQHDHRQGHLRRTGAEHVPRARQDHADGPRRAKLHALRLTPDRQQVRGAHCPVHRGAKSNGAHGARGDDLEGKRRPALLSDAARYQGRGRAVHDHQRLLQRRLSGAAIRVRDGGF